MRHNSLNLFKSISMRGLLLQNKNKSGYYKYPGYYRILYFKIRVSLEKGEIYFKLDFDIDRMIMRERHKPFRTP